MFSLTNAWHDVTIDAAAGGRICSWRIFGHEMLTGVGDHPVESGMYPMAPWAGRLRGNQFADHLMPTNWHEWAIHGAFLTTEFTVSELSSDAVTLTATAMVAEHAVNCSLTYRITDMDLDTTIDVSVDSGHIPVLLGWHPWFRREIDGHRAQWALLDAVMIHRGPDGLPNEERTPLADVDGPFDDVFFVPSSEAFIEWGVLKMQITHSHPWFVIFDELDEAVCVEPQNGPPNCTSTPGGAPIAQPGSPVRIQTRWRATQRGS